MPTFVTIWNPYHDMHTRTKSLKRWEEAIFINQYDMQKKSVFGQTDFKCCLKPFYFSAAFCISFSYQLFVPELSLCETKLLPMIMNERDNGVQTKWHVINQWHSYVRRLLEVFSAYFLVLLWDWSCWVVFKLFLKEFGYEICCFKKNPIGYEDDRSFVFYTVCKSIKVHISCK